MAGIHLWMIYQVEPSPWDKELNPRLQPTDPIAIYLRLILDLSLQKKIKVAKLDFKKMLFNIVRTWGLCYYSISHTFHPLGSEHSYSPSLQLQRQLSIHNCMLSSSCKIHITDTYIFLEGDHSFRLYCPG